MKVSVFIKEKVISNLNNRDLYEICRKKDEEGNIVFIQTI